MSDVFGRTASLVKFRRAAFFCFLLITITSIDLPKTRACQSAFEDIPQPSLQEVRKTFTLEQRVSRIQNKIGQNAAMSRLKHDLLSIVYSDNFENPETQKTLYGYLYELHSLESWLEKGLRVDVLPFRNGKIHSGKGVTDFVVDDIYVELKSRAIDDIGYRIYNREVTTDGVKLTLLTPEITVFSRPAVKFRLERLNKKLLKRMRKASYVTRQSVQRIEKKDALNLRAVLIHVDLRHFSSEHEDLILEWFKFIELKIRKSRTIDLDFVIMEISLRNKTLISFYSKTNPRRNDVTFLNIKKILSNTIY